MRQCNSGKQQQLAYGENGYDQFKCCSGLYTINIECGKNYVAENGDGHKTGSLRKKTQIVNKRRIAKGNSRRAKNKISMFCAIPAMQIPSLIPKAGGIVKTTSRFWNSRQVLIRYKLNGESDHRE
jgi:hypothetical protein